MNVFSAMTAQRFPPPNVTYRSAVTLQVFQPDTGQRSSIKKGPKIKDLVRTHQTVTLSEWSDLVKESQGFHVTQYTVLRIHVNMQ